MTLTRAFLTRLSGGDDLGIPEVGGERDLRLLERISARFAPLGTTSGWNAQFGRELNATDDRARFEPYVSGSGARPVVVLNKADLVEDVGAEVADATAAAGSTAVVAVSTRTRFGLDRLVRDLQPGVTLALLGPSGVGKSSIVNALGTGASTVPGVVGPGASARCVMVRWNVRENDACSPGWQLRHASDPA